MPSPSSYVAPVQAAVRRQDQGLDYQGKPGDSVVSIGVARVDAVKDDPNGFGKAIYYTLLSGPLKGQQIYVGHAQPTVRPGQYLQPGTPVATLLQHGLGNAGNLAGWTEVGFAKNGAPEPGSSSRFKQFVSKLGAAPAAPVASTVAEPAAPDVTQLAGDTTPLVPVAPPDPTLTHPQVFAPGSGGLEDVPSQLWRQIISQPNVHQDTLSYAQNAAIAAGG